MVSSILLGEKPARKPSLPVLKPTMGICLSRMRLATSRKVPSPPMQMAKSAVKESSAISSHSGTEICILSVRNV